MLTRSALLVAGLLTATGALAQTPNTSPVLPLGRFNVWLYSGAAARAFLDEGPHPGVTSVSFGQPQMHPSLVAAFHERGIALLDGIGGSQGCVSERGWKAQLDAKIKAGSDAIYVNEPWACPAPPGGFPGGAMDPANIAGLVEQYNPIHDYLLAERPGAVFGFCGGDQNWHVTLLQAGLREEFACVEQYNGSHIHYMDALKTTYPRIKTIALEYGTTALCSYGMGSAVVTGEENEVTYFDTWAAYDTTNTLSVSAGPIIDVSWKKNFLAFAATQKREFCKLPYSRVYAPITWAAQASDITIVPIDVKLASSAKYTLREMRISRREQRCRNCSVDASRVPINQIWRVVPHHVDGGSREGLPRQWGLFQRGLAGRDRALSDISTVVDD